MNTCLSRCRTFALIPLVAFFSLVQAAHSQEAKVISLSLAEAVETALLSNLGLQLKQHEVRQAEGTAQAAQGSFSPLLSAEVGATGLQRTPASAAEAETEQTTVWQAGVSKRFTPGTEIDLSLSNNTFDTDAGLLLFDPVYRSGLTLGITQPLLKGRGEEAQTADLQSARRSLEAQTFLVDDEAAALAAQVKNAYWELVFAHRNLEVLQLSLVLAQRLKEETAARIETGSLATIDIFQPESEVAVREQELISGQQLIGSAEDRLKLLINTGDWQTPLQPTEYPDVRPVRPDLATVMEKALANRPDLKAAALQIQAAAWRLKRAENERLPALDLYGLAGLGGTADSFGQAVDNTWSDSDHQWQIGVRFSHPLDTSLADGNYRQAAAVHARSRTSLEMMKQEVRRLARSTVRDIELALKTIEAAKKTTLARQKSLDAEHAKFEAGRSTTLDVLIAQQHYSQALTAEHRARVSYVQVLADLDRLQGIISLPKY